MSGRQEKVISIDKLSWKEIFGTRKGAYQFFVGDFPYKMLCTPTWNPWRDMKMGESRTLQFFGPDFKLPLLLGSIMGLQHALSMMTGIINGPLLITGAGYERDNPDNETITYIVAVAMMASGIFTALHVYRLQCSCTSITLGTGVISVMASSAGNAPLVISAIERMMARDKNISWEEAWGKVLGTLMVMAMVEIVFAFVPPRIIVRIFPGWLCGMVTFIVGIYLLPLALQDWGGGRSCARDFSGKLPAPKIEDCFVVKFTDNTNTTVASMEKRDPCYDTPTLRRCTVGEISGYFAEPKFLGLGSVAMGTIIFIEIFGSPFLRSINISMGLFIGMFVAAFWTIDGKSWYNVKNITSIGSFQIFFMKTWKLGFYAPIVIPTLILQVTGCVDSLSDITSTRLVSGLPVEGKDHEQTIQGGILGDGLFSVIGVLLTALPQTIYSSNNGIIALTKCASRSAGYWIGFWLFVAGFIGPFAALLANTPKPALGAINIFKFSFIVVAGVKLMCIDGLPRRQRVVLGIAGGFAIALVTVPQFADRMWTLGPNPSESVEGMRDGIIDIFYAPFAICAILAFILHVVLPSDKVLGQSADEDDFAPPQVLEDDDEDEDVEASKEKGAVRYVENDDSAHVGKYNHDGTQPALRPADSIFFQTAKQ